MSSKIKKSGKSANAANNSKQMTLNFQDTEEVQFFITGSGMATIDWGDGSKSETHALSTDRDASEACWHVYPDKSNYTVTLTGKSITLFECIEEQLTSLDVSGNTALTVLELVNCKIANLDVSRNLALESLLCLANQLTNLDVSKNTALTSLGCIENELTSLDVSNNTALTWLECACNNLTSLNVSKNTALTKLDCSSNFLINLDISKNAALRELDCSYNDLSEEALNDLFEMLLVLEEASDNPFECDFDLEEGKLNIDDNPGTNFCDVSIAENKGWKTPIKMSMTIQGSGEVIFQMAGYDWMRIDWNDDTGVTMDELSDEFSEYSHIYSEDTAHEITITGSNITHLYCSNNRITALDVSKNTALMELGCYNNQITHLDVSKNTELTKLECWANPLKNLNVGDNTELSIMR